MLHPSARRTDVIVQQVDPDTLVYDQLRDEAHSLSAVTGFVFRNADGSRSVEELTLRMSSELGVPEDAKLVAAALWELERAHLLDEASIAERTPPNISRRQAVRRFGAAALTLAAITSIAAPTPAMARSLGNIGSPPGQSKGKSKGPKGPKGSKGPKGPKGKP